MKAKSKKQLVAAIVAGLTLAAAAPAFAAANPFVDVPAKHWAYDSVSKLAAAGIVDGYGDGTFRGDRTMTRYEMAQIVAKAMARSDKADAEQKAMIDKLAQEFGDELHNLGVRMSNLENRVGNITLTGQVREWYEWTDKDLGNSHDNSALRTRLLLWMNAPLTKELTFTGRFWAESNWGSMDNEDSLPNYGSGTGADTSMDQAYLTYKHGNTVATLGRVPLTLGKGLTYNLGPNNDGVTVTVGDKVKLTGAFFRSGVVDLLAYDDDYHDGVNPNFMAANVAYQANKDLDLTLVYVKNDKAWVQDHYYGHYQEEDAINTWALGFGYKGINNITLTGEYGQNSADYAKATNYTKTGDHDSPQAWVGEIKYKGAQWDKPHTYGVWLGYRDADPGFRGFTGDPIWETASTVPAMDDVKGFNAGFDYTLFKNGVFTFNYYDLESVSHIPMLAKASEGPYHYGEHTDYKSMVAQLRYFF